MPPTFHTPNSTLLTPFGARYYQSTHSFWLSVDPLSDKYPNLSPYAYCGNNPVRKIDPNGMDIIEVDGRTGRTTITQQTGKDMLRCGRKSVELSGNGVFRKAQEAGEAMGNDGGTLLSGMSRSDARTTFNFMADNTNVEWGYMESADASGQHSYLVGSAHDPNTESLVFGKAMEAPEGSVLRYDHNHLRIDNGPLAHQPSHPENAFNELYVDTQAWSDLLHRNPKATLGIRHRGRTDIYIQNGMAIFQEAWIDKYIKH